MFKINLHAHTKYSDGYDTVEKQAKGCKSLGFSACVITDHVYNAEHKYSLSVQKFTEQLEEAKRVSEDLDYPVILGAEFSIAKSEECLVFGTEAIMRLLEIRHNEIFNSGSAYIGIDELRAVRSEFDCSVILCHPMLPEYKTDQGQNFIQIGGADVIDGFEIINSGQFEFRRRAIPVEFDGLVRVCNSDAHHSGELDLCYNLTTENITDEKSLIKYIKSRGDFVCATVQRHKDLLTDELDYIKIIQ